MDTEHSRLLIDEPPLQLLRSLAVVVGVNEALVLQQMHYLLARSGRVVDGRRWIRNSLPAWQKQFPFWSESTVKRIIAGLQASGYLLVRHDLNEAAVDRTNWYTIAYQKLRDVDAALPSDGNESPSGQSEPMVGVKLTRTISNVEEHVEKNTTGASAPGEVGKRSTKPTYTTDFLAFWAAYPTGHGSKKSAFAVWRRLRPDRQTHDAILSGLERWKACERWERGFILEAERFLTRRKWEDEPPPPRASGNGHATEPQNVTEAPMDPQERFDWLHSIDFNVYRQYLGSDGMKDWWAEVQACERAIAGKSS